MTVTNNPPGFSIILTFHPLPILLNNFRNYSHDFLGDIPINWVEMFSWSQLYNPTLIPFRLWTIYIMAIIADLPIKNYHLLHLM